MIENTENLREQVMISQFEMATGCTKEQSRQILQASRWEYLTALSMFFQDSNVVTASAAGYRYHPMAITGHLNSVCAPCNTPATPPSFPETLLALQKMQTNDWSSPSSLSGGQNNAAANNSSSNCNSMATSPSNATTGDGAVLNNGLTSQPPNPKVLTPFNPMPPPCDKLQQQPLNCDWSMTTDNEIIGSKLHRSSGILLDSAGENNMISCNGSMTSNNVVNNNNSVNWQQQQQQQTQQGSINSNNNCNKKLLFPVGAHQ